MAPAPPTTPTTLTTPTAMTVAEALSLPVLRRGLPEVLAGEAELHRPIRWVHAGEVPNIASLLSGGELLLTTGMGFGSGAAERRRFVAGLADRGLAALVIELGSTFAQIPEAMRQAAAEASLPLVALHREVPFVKVTEAIHTELVNRQYGLLRDGEAIQERLIELMLAGEGLPQVLSRFAELVGNPVFLEGPDGRLLFGAGNADDLDAWEGARQDPDGVGLQQTVPMGPASAPGRLAVLPTRRAPTELDAIALRHAAGIVALALLRAREEDELVVRQHGNLLGALEAGSISGEEAERQAARDGFRVRGAGLLAVAIDESPSSPEPVRAALLADLQRELHGRGLAALAGGRPAGDHLFALVALGDPGRRTAVADEVAAAVHAAWARRGARGSAVVAVDGPAGWDGAGAALAIAASTATVARMLPPRPWHDGSELALDRLLFELRDGGRLDAFVQRTLGPLLAHDQARKLHLLPTLEVLCAQGGHKAQAARELHLHRQALYHRLSRIESILGVSLSDPAQLLTLHVALRARFNARD